MLFQLQILYSVKWESTDSSGREFAPAGFLGLRVRIPLGPWTSVSCECCLFTGRGLCDRLITRTRESYRVVCLSECNREASIMRTPWPARGCWSHEKVGKWLLNQIGRICRDTAVTSRPCSFHHIVCSSVQMTLQIRRFQTEN
jgi:hypothetical protein